MSKDDAKDFQFKVTDEYFEAMMADNNVKQAMKSFHITYIKKEYGFSDYSDVSEYVKCMGVGHFLYKKPKQCYESYINWSHKKDHNAVSRKIFEETVLSEHNLTNKVMCNKETGHKTERVYARAD